MAADTLDLGSSSSSCSSSERGPLFDGIKVESEGSAGLHFAPSSGTLPVLTPPHHPTAPPRPVQPTFLPPEPPSSKFLLSRSHLPSNFLSMTIEIHSFSLSLPLPHLSLSLSLSFRHGVPLSLSLALFFLFSFTSRPHTRGSIQLHKSSVVVNAGRRAVQLILQHHETTRGGAHREGAGGRRGATGGPAQRFAILTLLEP